MSAPALRVLLVEDDEDDYLLTRDLLDSIRGGYALEWVAEYDRAVPAARSGAYDVILLDFRLGARTADEFIVEVRDGAPPPIVVLTGQNDRETDLQMMRLGAADYLGKAGLSAQVLERSIRYAVERARAHRDAAFLAAIVRGSHDAIIGKTLDGTIVSWNPAAERLYGYEASEVLGRSITLLVPPGHEDDLHAVLARVRAGEEVRDRETTRVRRDGSEVQVAITVSPVRGPGGGVVGASVIARDIGERRRMEEQLRQAQKMEAVGKLAGGIAHDFNNILTAIRGSAELVLMDLAAGDPLREDVEEIRAAADRAAGLTRQLLAFGRRQMLQPVLLDLNTVVAQLRPPRGPGVEMVMLMHPELRPVRADRAQLEQALAHLVDNARDALPRGGRIVVETRHARAADLPPAAARTGDPADASFVELSVSDDGEGIPPEILERVWEPFFTTRPPGAGTGLGLATVHGIVDQSGGRVHIASVPGAGTTVRIFLPSAESPAAPSAPPAPAPDDAGGTLLLVDDDAAVRAFGRRVLERAGFRVRVAGDGEEALRVLDEHPVAAVVTDAVMPRMDGLELRRRLAARPAPIPVLLLSGFTGDARAPGSGAFLAKPFSADDLVRAVREILAS